MFGCFCCAGTIILIIIVAPLSIIGLALIGLLYYRVQAYYHPTSRQLKRLESVTRSPIYQRLGETAAGIATIRSFDWLGSLERSMSSIYVRVDTNTRIMFYSFAVHRWLGVRLEAIGASIVFLASTLAILLSDSLGVGLVGLCISTTLGMAGNLNWTVRQVSEMENQLNAVERILEYAKLEPEETLLPKEEDGSDAVPLTAEEAEAEAAWNRFDPTFSGMMCRSSRTADANKALKTKRQKRGGKQRYASLPAGSADVAVDSDELQMNDVDLELDDSSADHHVSIEGGGGGRGQPPADWPSAGAISFENVSIAYRPDPSFPNVLSNVTAEVKAGEKIGIVGRTGAVSRST